MSDWIALLDRKAFCSLQRVVTWLGVSVASTAVPGRVEENVLEDFESPPPQPAAKQSNAPMAGNKYVIRMKVVSSAKSASL
jgi:hypothetical protein